jgi:hypothetical protein
MSERERWIVYPLLFLALGAALRDKLIDQTMSKKIVCQELIVYGEGRDRREPVKLVEIGAAPRASATQPQFGQIVVNGALRADAISADSYEYQGFRFAPNVPRVMPGADWLRALQQRTKAFEGRAKSDEAEANGSASNDEPPSSPGDAE